MKKIIALFATILISLGTLRAQTVAVSGTVVDELNRPMVGVSVVETDNVANGTVTDPQGRFSMKVKSVRSTIQTSYIGYITRILEVTAKPMTIAMEPSATNVEEVVVVGYGVQKKQSVVGAISSATSEDLKQMGSPNLSTALAGKVAGVTFTVPSGRPGSDDAEIYVRGVATMSGDSAPLVLVDGVERDYSQVDPEDIAQLSVLKDASATAVYGVRGANGVILITTKRGSKGAPKFNMNYTFTLQQPTRLPTFLGSYDHAVLRNESLANDGARPAFTEEDIEHYRLGDSPYTHPDNDYVKDFLRKTTPMHKLNVNVRGGTDNVRYYVALSGLSQEGIYRQFDGKYPSNANFKRINLRANLDFSLTKTTELSLDLNGRLDQKQNNSQGLNDNSIFSMMYETPPMSYPYRLPDGSYGKPDGHAQRLGLFAARLQHSGRHGQAAPETGLRDQRSLRPRHGKLQQLLRRRHQGQLPSAYVQVCQRHGESNRQGGNRTLDKLAVGQGTPPPDQYRGGNQLQPDLRRPCRNGDGGIHADQGEYQRRASAGLSGVCGPCDLRL